jgi:hypothetical protein
MRQLELFTSAQLATMRDRTRRRNYSAGAEGFRDAHQRHRAWGLTQRHARKLSRLYRSTANASAAFPRRADELASPSAPTRTAEPTASEPTASEPVGSGPLMPDRGHDAARSCDPSRPSRSGTTGRARGTAASARADRDDSIPGRPGKHRGRATKGMRRSARCPRLETDPGPAPAGGKNAHDRRRTRTHRTAASRPKGCHNRPRRDFLDNSPNTPFCLGNRTVIGKCMRRIRRLRRWARCPHRLLHGEGRSGRAPADRV